MGIEELTDDDEEGDDANIVRASFFPFLLFLLFLLLLPFLPFLSFPLSICLPLYDSTFFSFLLSFFLHLYLSIVSLGKPFHFCFFCFFSFLLLLYSPSLNSYPISIYCSLYCCRRRC